MQNKTPLKIVVGAVLFLSLSANMALAGMVAGAQNSIVNKVVTALSAFADLSGPSRDKTIDIVNAKWPEIKKELQDIRGKRQQIKEMLEKPDYKRADAEKIMAEIRKDVTELQQAGQTMALDIADAITPEERMALVKKVDMKP